MLVPAVFLGGAGVVVAVVAAAVDVAFDLGLVGDVDEGAVDATHTVVLIGIHIPLVLDFGRVGAEVYGTDAAAGAEDATVLRAVDTAIGVEGEAGIADGSVAGVAGADVHIAADIDPGVAVVDTLPLLGLGVGAVDATGNPGADGATGEDELTAAAGGGVGVAAAEHGAGDDTALHADGADVVVGGRGASG